MNVLRGQHVVVTGVVRVTILEEAKPVLVGERNLRNGSVPDQDRPAPTATPTPASSCRRE